MIEGGGSEGELGGGWKSMGECGSGLESGRAMRGWYMVVEGGREVRGWLREGECERGW